MNFPLSTFRYQSRKKDDPELESRMKYWAEKRPRYRVTGKAFLDE